MSSTRRGLAAMLGTAAALLLLLLARLPPSPSPAPAPVAVVVLPSHSLPPTPPPVVEEHTPEHVPEANRTVVSVAAAASSSSVPSVTAVKESISKPHKPKVVLTKELYQSGHLVAHPERCERLGRGVRLLLLVTSALEHRAARDAVRLTWGHYGQRHDIVFAFVLGAPPDAMQATIAEEDALYGDLIIGRSVDSYSNLTLKSLSLLEWADTYCPRAQWLLKTDDDMFINVPKLLAFIAAPQRANASKVIFGKLLKKSLPKRTPKSKYYLSPIQYAGRVLPAFCTGPAYLMPRDTIRPILDVALDRPYVRLEDVYVTGILADAAHVTRKHAPEFYNKKVSPHPCAIQRGVAIHMVRYHEQFDLWRKLLDGQIKCS